jgi:hypothetical protein
LITALPPTAFGSFQRWQRDGRAPRLGQPLAASSMPLGLAYGLLAVAGTAAVLGIVHQF